MNPLSRWTGQFGDEYTDRNQYDPATRVIGFRQIIPPEVKYVLEVGSNYGNNLAALGLLGITAIGIEPNVKALNKGLALGRPIIHGDSYSLPFPNNSFDLVMTCGVLIHIPDDLLAKAEAEIQRVTKKYVLAIEYTGTEGEKEYRGNHNMLWKRPSYHQNLRLVDSGTLPKDFDNATWILRQS
jgi:SAM-dependent methyltransferase